MADLRTRPAFVAAVAATRQAIGELASRNIADAAALVQRGGGWNNLQGHAHSLVPLAVFLARRHPQMMQVIRARTNLARAMTASSYEARDRALWAQVETAMRHLLRASGGTDILSEEMRSGQPQTARQIATTYLSTRYGGGQPRGGAGNTVIKRTLKLLAHVQLA